MARKYKTSEQGLFVRHFILVTTTTNGWKKEIGLTYVDALKRFGQVLQASDLEQAYERAGQNFKGQLKQTFVVLNDENANRLGKKGFRSNFGSGRKPENGGGYRFRNRKQRRAENV